MRIVSLKMKKYITATICCLPMLSVSLVYSQSILINNVPSTVLIVDPKGDTSGTSGTTEDVIVLSNGNVGIGTSTPAVRLDVRGDFRMVDGVQREGAFFVSDENGIASWIPADFIGRRVVWGELMTTMSVTANYNNITSTPLSLVGGLWLVVAKIDVTGNITDPTLTTTEYVWLKVVEELTNKDGTKTYTDISEGGLPYSIRLGTFNKYYSTPTVQAFLSIPVEGLHQKDRKYFVQIKSPSTDFSNVAITSDLSTGYFYAIKLQ